MGKSCYFMATCQALLTYNGDIKVTDNLHKTILEFTLMNATLTQPELQMKLIGQKFPQYTTNLNQLNINLINSLIQWNIQSINDKSETILKTLFFSKCSDIKYTDVCFQNTSNLWKCKITLQSNQPLNFYSIYEIPLNTPIYSSLIFTN